MKKSKHIVVIDAISFAGGSKVATNIILQTLVHTGLKVTIITNDKSCWHPQYQFIKLIEPHWLANKEQGFFYFVRHIILAMHLVISRVRYGPISMAVGSSGPGVDLSLYLSQPLLGFKIMQLIHGPVANSKTIARCLVRANYVLYLNSALLSIKQCLNQQLPQAQLNALLNSDIYHELNNGLLASSWPTQCQYDTPQIFWAASLLKWKGLDFFLQAIAEIPREYRPITEICYIRPRTTCQAVSHVPIMLAKLCWHEQPPKLDRIRARCNIFISTSDNEPFGLSILEALAAGHCVIIPKDHSHWDQTLSHGINCLKYQPNDLNDLVEQLLSVSSNIKKIKKLGFNGQQISNKYQAEKLHAKLKTFVLNEAKGEC